MKFVLLLIYVLQFLNSLFVQRSTLITSGSIQYEKTVNMYAICRKSDMSENSFEYYRNNYPQFTSVKSTLYFANNKTLFLPQENLADAMINSITQFPLANQRNIVYTDLPARVSVNQKKFFEETVLVKDSIRKITWKVTDEYREVAGFSCRRANAIILDSIYVVAFYTNEIHISGGPESFTGLPGMILEVALPHENVIWKATNVLPQIVPSSKIVAPQKGRVINNRQLIDKVNSSMTSFDLRLRNLLVKDLLL